MVRRWWCAPYKHAAGREQRLDRAFESSEKGDPVQLLREWTSAKLQDKLTSEIDASIAIEPDSSQSDGNHEYRSHSRRGPRRKTAKPGDAPRAIDAFRRSGRGAHGQSLWRGCDLRHPDSIDRFDLRASLGVAIDRGARFLRGIFVHGRPRDRPQNGLQEPRAQPRRGQSVGFHHRAALRILLPVSLGPPSLYAGPQQGSGTDRRSKAGLGCAIGDRL